MMQERETDQKQYSEANELTDKLVKGEAEISKAGNPELRSSCHPQGSRDHGHHHHSHGEHHFAVTEEVLDAAVVKSGWVDTMGMMVSTLCAFHCLATPFLVFAAPFFSLSMHHPLFHWVILALVAPLGVLAFWFGYKHHRQRKILILGITGLAIVSFGAIAPHLWVHFFGHYLITLLGSGFLIAAHYLNRRACRCHTHEV